MFRRIAPYIWLPLAGFVLGWWIRGAPAGRGDEPGARGKIPGAGESFHPKSGAEKVLSSKSSRRESEAVFTEADRRREIADQERMRATCRRKLELQVAEWQRELGLTADQVAMLRDALGTAVDRAEPPLAEVALPSLESVMRSMLVGERLAEFQQLGIRKAEALAAAKVEARVAEIGAVLLLSPAQQEALRVVLAGNQDWLPDPSRRVNPGLSPESLAEVTRRITARNDDGSGFLSIAGEVVREEIEANLKHLEPILSPDQLETYRGHLEELHAQWLHGGS